MLPKEKAKLKRLISNYVNIRIEESWAGGGDPQYHAEIKKEVRQTKKKLNKFINDIHQL